MPVFPMAVSGGGSLTAGWKVELGIGDPEGIADVGVYDTSRYASIALSGNWDWSSVSDVPGGFRFNRTSQKLIVNRVDADGTDRHAEILRVVYPTTVSVTVLGERYDFVVVSADQPTVGTDINLELSSGSMPALFTGTPAVIEWFTGYRSQEPSFTFPGTAGSYLTTDDTNLLGADLAHIQSSIGTWRSNARTDVTNTPQVPPVPPPFGTTALKGTVNTVDAISAQMVSSTAANAVASVEPSTEYAVSLYMLVVEGELLGRVRYRDVDKDNVSGETQWGTSTPLKQNVWTKVSVTTTSAVDADRVLVLGELDHTSGTLRGDEVYWISAVCVRTGSDPTFVPSLRIVGDLEMEIGLDVADYGANPFSILMSKRVPTGGYQTFLTQTQWQFQRDALPSNLTSVIGYIPTPGRHVLGVTNTLSNTDFLVDGVSVGSVGASVTSYPPQARDFAIFAQPNGDNVALIGDAYSAVVRDGIGGPVVARFDPTNYTGPEGPIPDGTTWQDITGRTWTAHGTVESVNPKPDAIPVYGSDDPFGYLVDVTSRVEGLSTVRGRERFTSRFRTGTAVVTVLNTDGAFTPPSGSGPPGILPLRPGRAVRITNNGADVFSGFIDSFTGYQGYDGKVSTSILCVDQFGQFTRNNLPAVTPEGSGDTVPDRMRRLLDRHIGDYTFRMAGTGEATFQATEMAQDLMFELALTADSEGGGVVIGKAGEIVAYGRDYFQDIAEAGIVKWSVGGTNPITIQGYTDEWAAIRIVNEAHFSRAGGTEQVRTNDLSIGQFGRRTHTRLDLICDSDTYVGVLAERLVQFAGVDRLRITGLTFLPEVGSDAAVMAVEADFGDLLLVTISTMFGVEWTAPVQVFGVQHTVSDEVWEVSFLTDDTLFIGEFYAFHRDSFDNDAFS